MPVELKRLADGQLPATKSTLYTCPASTRATVDVIGYNTSAVQQIVVVYSKRATSRILARVVLDQHESFTLSRVVLEAGDVIEAETTTASVVDYTLSGAIQT